MAYIIEIVGETDVYLVMSNTDQQIGIINGSDDDWYWQTFGYDVVHETSLARAKAAALREAKILEDKFLTIATEHGRRRRNIRIRPVARPSRLRH
ncbi:hypothetical protein [Rhodoblastus sp.]|uniref:hypothetical protein n=1 Tax=Rhodoblastus sp. TaxID=1962975 RepID=UPI003F9E5F5A